MAKDWQETEIEMNGTNRSINTQEEGDEEDRNGPPGFNPVAAGLRGFAIGVAEGAMASRNPTGRMFGAAMAGAMAPVYEQQRVELERLQAELDAQDYESIDGMMRDQNPVLDFKLEPPPGLENYSKFGPMFQSQGIARGTPFGAGPDMFAPTIKVETQESSDGGS
jgi:hypothetical protein